MPPSELTDAEQAELYFRRGLTLLWGVPITTPAVGAGARLLRALAQYLAGGAGCVGGILAWGAATTRRDQAAWALYAAMQRDTLAPPPEEIIDGTFTVRPATDPARRLPRGRG